MASTHDSRGFQEFERQKQQALKLAKEAERKLEEDLLNKYRKPTLVPQKSLQSIRDIERAQHLRNTNLNKMKQIDQKDKLVLEHESDDYDEDEKMLFKDQIQDGTYGPPAKQKKESVMVLSDGDEEVEILEEHLVSDDEPPNKQQYFKQRNKGETQGLGYGQSIGSIQNTFYSKYFNGSPHNSITKQSNTASLKDLAKNNSFLKSQKKSNQQPKSIRNIQSSSLCKGNGKKNPAEAPQPKGLDKTFLNNSNIDWAAHHDRKNFQQAQKQIKQKFKSKLDITEQKKDQLKQKLDKFRKQKRAKKLQSQRKQHDEVIDELFNYNLSNDQSSEKKYGGLTGLDELEDDSSSSKDDSGDQEISPDEIEDDDQKRALHEERMRLLRIKAQESQDREFEQKMRMVRFQNRLNVDELIAPILNLELVTMYQNQDSKEDQILFQHLPIKFGSSKQYFDIWLPLFLYETYNQLINQRNESDKDKELSQLYGMKIKNDTSQKNFQGLIQRSKQDHSFIYLKLLERDIKKDGEQKESLNKWDFKHLNSLKEFDLLLLSEKKLDTSNAKQLTSAKFLQGIQNEQGKMMAMVNQKRQQDKSYIEIKVATDHDKYVNLNCSEFDYHKMYVYYFDSMSTRIREFRTIKSAEFYPTAKFILNPSMIPKRYIGKQESDQEKLSQEFSDDLEAKDEAIASFQKKINSQKLPVDRKPFGMQNFIEKFQDKFNKSQTQALTDVSNMNHVDFLLIQGPPGTGKTHTIKGIISMLNSVLRSEQKILVCAPSNAAIDEIVTRLISKGGLLGQNEEKSIEKVLRIGSFDYEPSEIVKKVTFDTKFIQAQQTIETKEEKEKNDQQIARWKDDIEYVNKIIKIINTSKQNSHFASNSIKEIAEKLLANKSQIDDFMKFEKEKKLSKVKKYQDTVKVQLADLIKQRSSPHKQLTKAQRKSLEKRIVDQTQIICTTLAMSTNEKLETLRNGDIGYLIVDEACQSVELNNLIPFEHQPQRVILVGDQQQLPATTFSENAEKTQYSRSMFERFLQCGIDRVMLETQYRMDPIIREFPSMNFYESRLCDAQSILERQRPLTLNPVLNNFMPMQFFDLTYSVETSSETSKVNQNEVIFIEQLLKAMMILTKQREQECFKGSLLQKQMKNNSKEQLKGTIGIISPYRSQVRALKGQIYAFLRQYADVDSPQDFIEINTVDAFQGREKDIIIFSCVRSNRDGGLGFVTDYRRMNVAITRARHALFIVGNSSTLVRDKNWKSLIEFCKNKNKSLCRYFREFKDKNEDLVKNLIATKKEVQPPIIKKTEIKIEPKFKKPQQGLIALVEDEKKTIKRKSSDEEEGQVFSSGQIADKQTTEADDQDSQKEVKKKNDAESDKSSFYQSYQSNRVYGKDKIKQELPPFKKNSVSGSNKSDLIPKKPDAEPGEILSQSSDKKRFPKQPSRDTKFFNEWDKSESFKNCNWENKAPQNYHNNNWGRGKYHNDYRDNRYNRGHHDNNRYYNSDRRDHHERSRSRSYMNKRDQKERDKQQQRYDNFSPNETSSRHQKNHYVGKRPRY